MSRTMGNTPRHFLDLTEMPVEELRNVLALSSAMKKTLKAREPAKKPLDGKVLAMIFDKPSTRTRVSFDVGMRQLGGEAIMLTGTEMQLGRGETIADTARVLSLMMLIMGLAPVLAPQLGGLVQLVAGWRGVFWTLVVFAVVIGAWVLLGLPESRSPETLAQARSENPLRAYVALFGMRRLVGYALAGALNGAVLFTYISTAPDLVMGTYGHTPLTFNLIFALNAVGIIGASQVNRWLLRRSTPDQVLRKASIASIVAALLLTVAAWSGWGGQWTVLPLLFAALSVYGLMGGNTMAGALSVDPRRAGSISALMGSASFGAGALASWVGGLLHDGTAKPVAAVMFACLVGSSLAIFFLALPGGKKVQA